ncbi:hypothetical protein [Lysinibacillus xylanilyticus]|uniref:hypothetical protein n=1 Tax=Lysinibacillus xylanilyticus TaxID=582475 RepID=UPI0036DDADF4
MQETIIIYTKYYSEAVIEVLDKYDLNIQILCFSSYDDVLAHVKRVPNLIGLIFLEYKARNSAFKAYNAILTVADEIAASSKQPFCASIISNNETPRKFLNQIKTSNVEVFFTKFLMFNTDLVRFEGLATVIRSTIGIANETILLELEKGGSTVRSGANTNKMDFLKYCLQIITLPQNELNTLNDIASRFPELEKLLYLRHNSDKDAEILARSENLFKLFAEQCIARREQDDKKDSILY